MYTSKEQQHLHSKLVTASWVALATTVMRGSDISSSSYIIITKAIETRSIVERLRLGLAMVLDNQMPYSGREESVDVVGELNRRIHFKITYDFHYSCDF